MTSGNDSDIDEATRLWGAPTLVVTAGPEVGKRWSLKAGATLLGRASECDIVLADPHISRKHATLSFEQGTHVLACLSNQGLRVNGEEQSQTVLFNGDLIEMGPVTLRYESGLPREQRPAPPRTSHPASIADSPKVPAPLPVTVVAGRSTSRIAYALLGVLLVVLASLLWPRVADPWRLQRAIVAIERELQANDVTRADVLLQDLLADERTNPSDPQLLDLHSRVILALAKQDHADRQIEAAIRRLDDGLSRLGSRPETVSLQTLLDSLRHEVALEHEEAGRLKEAMTEYLRIAEGSTYFEQAQRSVSRLWYRLQQAPTETASTDITALLDDADRYAAQFRFLTPATGNAYRLYLDVLEKSPDNRRAREGIDRIKRFYLENAERFCRTGKAAQARTYYQRYLIIDPGNDAIRDRQREVTACRAASPPAAVSSPTEGPSRVPDNPGKNNASLDTPEERQRLESELRAQGVESDWIIQYLFDENGDGGDRPSDDTPWQ